jgi:hypothetical protein
MCVPVLPNSNVDPQSIREPLRPNPELPWADCYHSSSDHLVVRILPQPGAGEDPHTVMTVLPASDVSRHSNYICEDYRRRNKVSRRRIKEVKIARKELNDLLEGIPANVTLDEAALEEAQVTVSRATEASKALKKSLSRLMNAQQTPIMTVRISHDLSLVKDLPDPRELLNQQIYLAEMSKKSSAVGRAVG